MTRAERPKILLVDDNESVLEASRLFFQRRGFEIITASSPFGVTALIKREQPSVVILDVMMPALDGGGLAKLLATAGGRGVYTIILYSALPEEELYQLARSLTCCLYVSKTAGLEALATTVGRCCGMP